MSLALAVAAMEAAPATAPDFLAFQDADLDLLHARALLARVDRKFLLPVEALAAVLAPLPPSFRLLRAAGEAAASYRTQYFDTADDRMYHDHRRGRFPRLKVRLRHHLERQLTFLEIKRRGQGGTLTKARLPRPFGTLDLDDEAWQFIARHTPFAAGQLVARVTNEFRRATLLGVASEERVTIDWNLCVSDGRRSERLHGLVVLEIKQARYSNLTAAIRAVRALGFRENALSKYCLAIARLTGARSNAFRRALRTVERLNG